MAQPDSMCERTRLSPDSMANAMKDLATAPSTGVDQRPGDIVDRIMRAPTVEAVQAIIDQIHQPKDVA